MERYDSSFLPDGRIVYSLRIVDEAEEKFQIYPLDFRIVYSVCRAGEAEGEFQI